MTKFNPKSYEAGGKFIYYLWVWCVRLKRESEVNGEMFGAVGILPGGKTSGRKFWGQ